MEQFQISPSLLLHNSFNQNTPLGWATIGCEWSNSPTRQQLVILWLWHNQMYTNQFANTTIRWVYLTGLRSLYIFSIFTHNLTNTFIIMWSAAATHTRLQTIIIWWLIHTLHHNHSHDYVLVSNSTTVWIPGLWFSTSCKTSWAKGGLLNTLVNSRYWYWSRVYVITMDTLWCSVL